MSSTINHTIRGNSRAAIAGRAARTVRASNAWKVRAGRMTRRQLRRWAESVRLAALAQPGNFAHWHGVVRPCLKGAIQATLVVWDLDEVRRDYSLDTVARAVGAEVRGDWIVRDKQAVLMRRDCWLEMGHQYSALGQWVPA